MYLSIDHIEQHLHGRFDLTYSNVFSNFSPIFNSESASSGVYPQLNLCMSCFPLSSKIISSIEGYKLCPLYQ